MSDAAHQPSAMVAGDFASRTTRGAIHFLNRCLPLIFEDKEFLVRALWSEQSFFQNQINAICLMEAITILMFKPGFTIMPLKEPPS
jgi:hypothetical protein